MDGLSGHPPPIAGRAPACNRFFLQANPSRGPTGRKNRREPAESRQVAGAAHREITRAGRSRVSAALVRGRAVPGKIGRRAVVSVSRSVLATGGQQSLTTPRGQKLTTPGRDLAEGEHSRRRRLPCAAWHQGTAIAQGRRMSARREERRHPGQAARERILIPADPTRGLTAPARRECTAP